MAKSADTSSRSQQSQGAKKFKYRSIKSIHRKKIIEDKRLQLEAEHYQHDIEIDVLTALNDGEQDPQREEQRSTEIEQRETRMEEIEKQLGIYNDKYLDVVEEEEDVEEDQTSNGRG